MNILYTLKSLNLEFDPSSLTGDEKKPYLVRNLDTGWIDYRAASYAEGRVVMARHVAQVLEAESIEKHIEELAVEATPNLNIYGAEALDRLN